MVYARLLAASCILLGCEPLLVVGDRSDAGVDSAGATGAAGTGGVATGGAATGGAAGGTATGGAGNSGAGAPGSAGEAGAAGAAGAADSAGAAGAAGAQCPAIGNTPAPTDPIAVPWATGFENGFCDYEAVGGFCFGGGTRTTVTSPTRSGFAAEFSVATTDTARNQTRCVRQGVLPPEAYYGAWYYIPATATLSDPAGSLWNLFHFQGGDTSTDGLWDISLVNGDNGDLELLVFDFLKGVVRKQAKPIPIPIGSWFHIQFYLKRRSDATGAIRLYQDGQLLVEATGIVTDDSSWGQWYVGNIAKLLTPPDNTLYVDDVSIATTLN